MERNIARSGAKSRPSEIAVVTRAAIRAAEALDLPARTLASIIGVSEASVSRMRKGNFLLERDSKPFDLALLFIRLFRSLDAITGGDETVARAWLRNPNTALGGVPVETIRSVPGLVDAIAYLDTRRALL